jgi:hypothetical protein
MHEKAVEYTTVRLIENTFTEQALGTEQQPLVWLTCPPLVQQWSAMGKLTVAQQ